MANNLLQGVQSFMTPELIGKASTLTGDTPSRTKASLASAIPTLLMGIAHHGSTPEGAGRLMETIREGGYEQGVPANLTEQFSGGAATEDYLLKGRELTSIVFGSKLGSVSSGLAGFGGDSGKSGKLLALFAPVALGVLGSHVKMSGMNASGLSSFLCEQKGSLKSLLPGGLDEHFISDEYREPLREVPRPEVLPRTEAEYTRGILADRPKRHRASPWPIALLALLILGSLFIFRDHGREVMPPTQEEANVNTQKHEAAAPQVAQPQGAQEPPPVAGTKAGQQLAAILAPDSQVPLPQRIPLPDTKFDEGGTQLSAGSEGEINNVASVLKAHPTAQARVDGYTDNASDAAASRQLSVERAKTVEQALTEKGVASDQLKIAGAGADAAPAPDSNNTSPPNRTASLLITQR